MLRINDFLSSDTCLVVEAAGRVTGDEYEVFAERFEQAVKEHGEVDLVINLTAGVSYGDMDAFKDDWRFGVKEYRHARRVAVVGDVRLLNAIVRLFSPFTRAEEGFFPPGEVDAAVDWASAD
jgi:hypothetical protein